MTNKNFPPEQKIEAAIQQLNLGYNAEQDRLLLKVGDKVLFGKYAGQTVKVDGEELLVMREEDIMGVVEK